MCAGNELFYARCLFLIYISSKCFDQLHGHCQPVPGPLHYRPPLHVLHPGRRHLPRGGCQVWHCSPAGISSVTEGKILSQYLASQKGTTWNNCQQIKIRTGSLFRDTLLLLTWSAWTPRRGRQSRRSRGLGLGLQGSDKAYRGVYSWLYITLCRGLQRCLYSWQHTPLTLSVQGLSLGWQALKLSPDKVICHCRMATAFAVYVNLS